MRKNQARLGMLDVLLAILIDPRGVTRRLFTSGQNPPLVLPILLTFLAICVVLPASYASLLSTGTIPYQGVAPLVLTVLITMLCAAFLLMVALRSLNFKRSTYTLLAALVYATAPCTTILVALLLANKVTSGDLSLLGVIASGFGDHSNVVVRIFPTMLMIAQALAFLTLSQSLRALTHSSLGVSLLLGIIAIPLILGSFIIALTATDLVFPSSSPVTIQFFSSYAAS